VWCGGGAVWWRAPLFSPSRPVRRRAERLARRRRNRRRRRRLVGRLLAVQVEAGGVTRSAAQAAQGEKRPHFRSE